MPMSQPVAWYLMYLQQLQVYAYWSSKAEASSPEEMRREYGKVQARRRSLEREIKDAKDARYLNHGLTPAAKAHVEKAILALEGSHAAVEFVEDLLDKTCDPDIDKETWPEGYVLAKVGWRVVREIARVQLLLLGEEP